VQRSVPSAGRYSVAVACCIIYTKRPLVTPRRPLTLS